jgi:hypothetical protein
MTVLVRNSQQMAQLINGLARDIVDGNIHFKLFLDLSSHLAEYEREFRQSWTFWSLTLRSHIELTHFYLSRAYDQNPKSLCLHTWLKMIRENLHLFEADRFPERLKASPFVDSLAQGARKPDPKQLAIDRKLVASSDPLVNKLVRFRNNALAHRSAKEVMENHHATVTYPLAMDEVKTLLARAIQILNRYSGLFHAQTYSTQVVGHDDYEGALKAVRSELERREAEIQKEIEEYERRSREASL